MQQNQVCLFIDQFQADLYKARDEQLPTRHCYTFVPIQTRNRHLQNVEHNLTIRNSLLL